MGIDENGVDEIEELLASGKLDENASVADIAALLDLGEPEVTQPDAKDKAGDAPAKADEPGDGDKKADEAADATQSTDKADATDTKQTADTSGRDQQTTDAGPIAGPNGTTIPYAVLAGTRRDLSDARRKLEEVEREREQDRERAERAERELNELRAKQQTAAAQTQDVQAAADAAGVKGNVLTIDTTKLRESFPAEIVDAIEALQKSNHELARTVTDLRQRETRTREETQAEILQRDIDSVPALADWQANDQIKWAAAKAVDDVLRQDPTWKDRPRVERFAEVARQLGGQSQQSTTTKADPAAAGRKTTVDDALARADRQAVPVSHSGLPAGGAPAQTEAESLAHLDASQIADKFSGMTDEQIEKLLARVG